jgi:flagellar hook-associated protein 1 FlgK
MSSIIDIARSGIMAYRTALSVTAENVANVNTEGYLRRDVEMTALTGAAMTPTSGATLGQGVLVTDIRRAFDGLTADRLRAAQSALSAADTRVETGAALEAALMAGKAGIDRGMSDFFGALTALSAQPADTGLRRVAMAMGSAVAGAFSDAARGLSALGEEALGRARLAAGEVTSLLQDLHALNRQMIGVRATPGALNPLHDQRDAKLAELAQRIEVNVTLDADGLAEVRLGPGPGGLALLDRATPARVAVGESAPLGLLVSKDGAAVESVVLTGGSIAGQAAAIALLREAGEDLDALARRFAANMNDAHAAGIDLDGQAGGVLFRLTGIDVAAGQTNRGSAGVSLSGSGLTAPVRVTFDATTQLWTARDMAGAALASGAPALTVGGVTIRMEGRALDGDSFTLSPRTGRAADMAFVLADPRRLAAASPMISAPAAGNRGTGAAVFDPLAVATGAAPLLATALAGGGAVTLIQPGVAGVVPAGTALVELASLGRQATADFPVSDAALAGGGSLELGLPGQVLRFALPPGLDVPGAVSALNDGTIPADTGETLASLGLRASGLSGQLGLSLAEGDFTSARLVLPGGVTEGLRTAALPVASGLQVFTRDGRQIAGPALDPAQAAQLLTEANGFTPGARYVADHLTAASGTGYRGIEVTRQVAPGAEALVLRPSGLAAGTLALASGGVTANVPVPEGASAARLAALAQGALPGLVASAETVAVLSGIADGALRFDLAGQNVAPVTIRADVVAGDLSALTRAINAATAATGIAAELSPDGTRLMLRQGAGEDIRLTGLTHAAGAGASLTPTDATGLARGPAISLGGALTAARITGEVRLNAPQPFSAVHDGLALGSAPDAQAGEMVALAVTEAGYGRAITFAADPVWDGALTSASGLSATAAGLSHELNVNGVTVTQTGATTPEAVALALRDALRDAGPQAEFTGGAVAALPPDGAALAVRLDGQTHVVRMQAGAPVVEGPEPGRLLAAFDATGRLRLTVAGGVSDGAGPLPDLTGPQAAAFGVTQGQQVLTGQAVDPAAMPPAGLMLAVTLGQSRHEIGVTLAGGVPVLSVPSGFPGQAAVTPDGRITIAADAALGPLRAEAAPAAGFAVAGVTARVEAGALRLGGVGAEPPSITVAARATAGERLRLTNLPPEDLIVVMSGGGALTLAGAIGPAMAPEPRATELRITDAASRAVALIDSQTGHSIATGTLDSQGQTVLGGYRITVSGTPATGDGFVVQPNLRPDGDARALRAMTELASADPGSGKGGFARILAELTTDHGARQKAALQRQSALGAAQETLERKMAAVGAVDLDAEAARLVELQQAYQASAQALSIARQLFDTILNAV